jgi:DNA polymerase III subunit delta'
LPEPVYPGVRAVADRLLASLAGGRAGQPYLFVGPEGSGKEVTALEIVRRAQCAQPGRCGPAVLCESCQKAVTFQHPDIVWLGPAPASLEDSRKADEVRALFQAKVDDPFFQPGYAASSQILIGNPDQPGPLTVRGLLQFLRRQAFQGPWQAAIVCGANRLNPAAANALLKTLEEPPPGALLILIASSSAGVLPTILSRCQQVLFTPYPRSELLALLERQAPQAPATSRAEAARLADGNIRKALAWLDDENQGLRRWTEQLFAELGQGHPGPGQVAAERLHQGAIGESDLDLHGRRRQALLVCETLATLLAEAVACRELGSAWQPRASTAAELVRTAANRRSTAALLQDIARVERAKQDIDGNLNLGLVMAVLLRDLGDHA